MKKLSLLLCATLLVTASSYAQFTSSNLAVFEAASATSNNTNATIVELNKTTASQTSPTTYAINGTTGTNALRFSGSATSTGYLATSDDKSLLCFTGGNTTTTTGNINTFTTRGVGTFNPAGTYNLAATYTGATGSQTRSATTVNDTAYYIADQGGIYTNNATTASPTGNFRGIKSFGGTVYVASSSATTTIIQVNTVSAPTGGTVAGLNGLSNDATIQDFYLIQSGSNGTAYDVLYVVYATSNTAGTIAKFSLVSGSWTSNGTYTTTFGGFGIAAEKTSSGANLYVSSGQGALAANSVIKLADAAGFNSTLSITTANNVTLYTAGTGATVKGVAFAPVNAPALTTSVTAIANTFISSIGTPSASDSFTVSGANLTGNITVTAPASFQVATSLTGTYGSSVTLTASTGTLATTKVYVRFLPTATGTVTGNVVVSATGAASKNVSVTGATPGPVVLTSVSSIANTFITFVGTQSAPDSFTVSGTNLNGNVTVTAPASFQVASTLGGTYGSTITLTPTSGTLAATKVYVRFAPTAPGPVTGNVTITSTGATTQNVSVTGNTPPPTITASTTSVSTNFTAIVGGTSGSDTFSVFATALNAPLVVTAPANFEVATSATGTFSASLSLTPTTGAVASTLIYVRFHPLSAGTFNDTVKLSSTGATTRYVLVSGTTIASTNPAAYNLSGGSYLFNQWDSASAAGTYPPNMIFHTTNNVTLALTAAPLVGNWKCPYNLTTRPRFRGLNANGVSMINTGSAQYDDCSSGATTMNTFVGAALLAISTTSVSNITLKYDAGLVKQSDGATPRVYNLRLQYRLDSISAFTDMTPLSEYTSAAKTDGDVQNFSMLLPAQFENKAYVEFRWLYYADATVTAGSGTRPEIRLDEIRVVSNATGVGQLGGNGRAVQIYPNPVIAGGAIRFSEPLSGKMYDAFGRIVASFSNATKLETAGLASGIYSIISADGGHCRITIQ